MKKNTKKINLEDEWKDIDIDYEWMKKYCYIQWQITRRHREYLDFCNKYKNRFDRKYRLKGDGNKETDKIKNRFNLQEIYHYNAELTPEQCVSREMFKNVDTVARIWPDTQSDKSGPQTALNLPPPEYKHYIDVRINIDESITKERIVIDLIRLINYARILRKLRPFTSKTLKRFQGKEDTFKVWDLRCKKIGYLEIAKKLYPNQGTKQAIDKAKKQYARAYEIIYEEKYNPYKFKREPLIIKGSDKQCKTCPDRDKCTELCPQMIAIVSNDENIKESAPYQIWAMKA
jgi:hypothetical protein